MTMQQRTCAITGQTFTISDEEEQFCLEQQIPLPTTSPFERLRQVSAFLSSIFLYPHKCALTGKDILTFIPPHKDLVVYDIDVWQSDAWDPLAFGQDYDFSRPFFEQFQELMKKAPLPSLECIRSTMENSDYTNGVLDVKNCYLSFGILGGEDVLFSRTVIESRDIIDSIYVTHCELCVGCVEINNCYNLRYSVDCSNCSDSTFLYDCRNCKHCYGSSNLIGQEYYFRNQACSPEEYQRKISEIDLGSHATVLAEKQKFAQLRKQAKVKYLQGKNNENSDGNYLDQTKNCHQGLFLSQAENVEWSIQMIHDSKDCFVCDGFGQNGQKLYCCSGVGENAYNIKFCFDCYSNIRDLEYCIFVGFGSMDCFGCIGLKKKQYCILNKQYTKEAYFDLLARIKEHMRTTGEYGQFFPAALSPMDYNRSEAQVFFPTTQNQATQLGFSWFEEQPDTFIPTFSIPDHIKDVSDDITNQILRCANTGKKYRIIKQELAAYRKMNIPVPRISPTARLEAIQNSLIFQEATTKACKQCQKPIMTVYDPTEVKVVCERCYQEQSGEWKVER